MFGSLPQIRRLRFFRLSGLPAFACLALIAATLPRAAAGAPACVPQGRWMAPSAADAPAEANLFEGLSKRPVVLLGETHTSAEHHRWQLHVISALHGRNPNMVLGFEAFPRSVQPVLDQWTQGTLSEPAFLEKSRWHSFWRFDPELYMPLFHFARMHRIPMIALNFERDLVGRIRAEGWAAVAPKDRHAIGDPAAPSEAYVASLKKVFAEHDDHKPAGHGAEPADGAAAFARFLDVQLAWDRAMAEALAGVRQGGGAPLVVGIVGRGHVEYGYGIPRQLQGLGVEGAAVLLPWDSALACDLLLDADGTAVADAVFGLTDAEPPQPPKQMLGVQIETIAGDAGQGVRVVRVVAGSIAETAGIAAGDVIVAAAGQDTGSTGALVAVVRRQAPGTWLPLSVLRGGNRLDIVAKFPPAPAPSQP